MICALTFSSSGRATAGFARFLAPLSNHVSHLYAMEILIELLFNAYTKFLGAGLSADHAHFGVFGIWTGPGNHKPLSSSDSPLDRARASRDAWLNYFGSFPNPYSDLVLFYEAGASLGRWENHILDVFGPNDERLGGIPRASFIKAANIALQRTPSAPLS